MNKIQKKIPFRSEFVNNAFKLTIGTGISQIIPIIFYPVLGRIFTPLDFGILGLLTSITAILSSIASGNYEYSILITETRKDAVNMFGLVIIISFSILLISFIILQMLAGQFATLFKEPALKEWLFICPISAFMIIVYNSYNEWCVRNKYFGEISFNKITNSASTTLSKLFTGLAIIMQNGLVVGDLTGRIISAGACVIRLVRKNRHELLLMSSARMKLLMIRYNNFPKFGLPAELLNTIGVSIPILLIGAHSNSSEVGYYAMTMNVISVPISVLSVSLRDVFRQRANEEYSRTGTCSGIFKRLLMILLACGFSGSLILFFILPGIFSIVLGEQWRVAGEYSQILLPMIALDFVCISLNGVFIITEKMVMQLYWQIYYVVITFLSIDIGFIFFNDIRMVLICFAIGRSSAYLLYIILSYRFSLGDKSNCIEK